MKRELKSVFIYDVVCLQIVRVTVWQPRGAGTCHGGCYAPFDVWRYNRCTLVRETDQSVKNTNVWAFSLCVWPAGPVGNGTWCAVNCCFTGVHQLLYWSIIVRGDVPFN